MEELFGLLLSILLGVFLGVISGLTPGIHPNTFALIISSFVIFSGFNPLYAVVIILSASVTNSFLDIIPSIFIGAPDPEMVLTVLPSHEMVLEGRGLEAVRLSALGSLLSVFLSFLLIFPLSLIFTNFYDEITEHMVMILVMVSALLILSESEERIEGEGKLRIIFPNLKALFVFLLSGALGYVAFEREFWMSSSILQTSVLFPLLSGLFGASFLITSVLSSPEIPEQKESNSEIPRGIKLRGAVIGSLAGSFVAWIPGISSSVATVLSRLFLPKSSYSREEFIVSLSGVNTSNMILSLIALYMIGKARTGAMVYIREIHPEISFQELLSFLLLILGVSMLSYHLTIFFGRIFARIVEKVNYAKLCTTILLFLTSLVLLLGGLFALSVYLISTLIGLIPPRIGVRRVNCMSSLLLPLIFYYL